MSSPTVKCHHWLQVFTVGDHHQNCNLVNHHNGWLTITRGGAIEIKLCTPLGVNENSISGQFMHKSCKLEVRNLLQFLLVIKLVYSDTTSRNSAQSLIFLPNNIVYHISLTQITHMVNFNILKIAWENAEKWPVFSFIMFHTPLSTFRTIPLMQYDVPYILHMCQNCLISVNFWKVISQPGDCWCFPGPWGCNTSPFCIQKIISLHKRRRNFSRSCWCSISSIWMQEIIPKVVWSRGMFSRSTRSNCTSWSWQVIFKNR